MKGIRLDKYLSDMGKGTRSQIKSDIRKGMVCVNGAVENSPERKVTKEDEITYGQERVSYEKYRYYLLNKPSGVITATKDESERTVLELIREEDRIPGLFPVGRLDKDTEGLLLLTNDGELAHQLLSPRKHVRKTYFVRLEGILSEDDIARLHQGIALKDKTICKPAECTVKGADYDAGTCEVELSITEGKYHQVKRMMAACKTKVVYLKRISMGDLKLDASLETGAYRELSKEEVLLLKESTQQ